MPSSWFLIGALALAAACTRPPHQPRPPAHEVDPPRDAAFPATMVVLHIPTGEVTVNGVAYVAPGRGPHPTVLLLHGLPGNEKNLDLAQAVRRSGWNVVTMSYRGSWGSEGSFSFRHTLEDARAALAYLRAPDHASTLRTDPGRLVVAGHSMGGWVAALTAARETLLGVILISAADMGSLEGISRDQLVDGLSSEMETLAGTSAAALADELLAGAPQLSMVAAAPALRVTPLLALTSDDGGAIETQRLLEAIRAAGGTRAAHVHVATDHAWSDRRLRLATEVIAWLDQLR